ncbi:MAG TPA: DUF1801 domain-containing protein [Phycisphaerales bacterium]|nr:DUF1801 domain-containing protein [Phycisphaerales bacterium]
MNGADATMKKNSVTRNSIDWRSKTLSRIRTLITHADPEIIEETKWRKPSNPAGVPTWSHSGVICTGETYKNVVKMTFAKGASLPDPARLFNSSLEGTARRAIDFHEGDTINAKALKTLIREAVKLNTSTPANKRGASPSTRTTSALKPAAQKSAKPKLLSGGNPQIAKADGDAPVQAYIAAMPGWKSAVGRKIDAIIHRTVSTSAGLRKAVKWNSPMYGMQGRGWFISMHCFAKFVRIAFFDGASLHPLPPGLSKLKNVRYLDIREDDHLDERQFSNWVKQTSKLQGWSTV